MGLLYFTFTLLYHGGVLVEKYRPFTREVYNFDVSRKTTSLLTRACTFDGVIILSDHYRLPLAVGSFIPLTQSTQPAPYTRGGVVTA